MTRPYSMTNDCGDESFLRQFMMMKKQMNGVLSQELFGTTEDPSLLTLLL